MEINAGIEKLSLWGESLAHLVNAMKILSSIASALVVIPPMLCPLAVRAWTIEGKWSTASFNCQDTDVQIGVDMNSKIGGGDAAPVRVAYMLIEGERLDSVWIVGASMNTLSSNNRNHEMIFGGNDVYLKSIGQSRRDCIAY